SPYALRSAQLSGAVSGLTDAIKAHLDRQYRQPYDDAVTAMRRALGQTAFNTASETGKRLTVDEAVALATSAVIM
ncbi:MAG TPA: hypothetical protein VGK87_10915, partial [Anaerolineae bacterium]